MAAWLVEEERWREGRKEGRERERERERLREGRYSSKRSKPQIALTL